MSYDHHHKAGNEGDVIKHPVLIAALDSILQQTGSTGPFHYLDLFAGHAWHPLLDGDEFEWRNGIGNLASKSLPSDAPESVKIWWKLWHKAPEWPEFRSAGYPGSAWIAADRCRDINRAVVLELYDISDDARRDLERAFPPVHAIQVGRGDVCLIGQSINLSRENLGQFVKPNFVFIDPPGWQSDNNPSFPRWEDLFANILKVRSNADNKLPTLLWMPAGGQNRTQNKKDPNKENSGAFPWDQQSSGHQRKKCESLEEAGYDWSAIRWNNDSYSACILAYNCAQESIRSAVGCITCVAGDSWKAIHSH